MDLHSFNEELEDQSVKIRVTESLPWNIMYIYIYIDPNPLDIKNAEINCNHVLSEILSFGHPKNGHLDIQT